MQCWLMLGLTLVSMPAVAENINAADAQDAAEQAYQAAHDAMEAARNAAEAALGAANDYREEQERPADPKALFEEGMKYYFGSNRPRDLEQAYFKFRSAADLDYPKAQGALGILYELGEGVAEDKAQAVYWYRKAAEQGEVLAQHNLGILYDKGEGVPKNDQQAIHWYRKAANQTNASAINNLAVKYEFGTGVGQSSVLAYALYNLAAIKGDAKTIKNRDRIEATLTPAARQVAQQVSSWFFENDGVPLSTKIDRFVDFANRSAAGSVPTPAFRPPSTPKQATTPRTPAPKNPGYRMRSPTNKMT